MTVLHEASNVCTLDLVVQDDEFVAMVADANRFRVEATVTARSDMKLVVVMNRDVWRLDRESPDVSASLRETIADCLERSAQQLSLQGA